MAKIRDIILERYQAAEDYLATKRDAWDTYEKLFHNELADAISEEGYSKVFDPKLATLSLERSYRVMAQFPTGKLKAISKNDLGAGQLMNLVIDKYVNVNANAQFDLLTKFRMVDLYSHIYGNFFTLVDWDVKKNGYVGPDIWLLNIRDVLPQVGAVSLDDSDYVIVRTWKPLSFFKSLKEEGRKGYKRLDELITKLTDKTGSKATREAQKISKREDTQYPRGEAAKKMGYFEVLTMYERDRWVDFCVDADMEFRDIKNQHEDGEFPITCKYSIPLLDDFMGMGDFERGASMQQVINSNWNLYLNAVKMSIFPPVIINKESQAAPSSFQYIPAAKWLARGQVNNVATTLQLSPKGIETFNNTYQAAGAALLNLFGTTDTTVTRETEVGFGRTPRALAMQQNRENTRDNADRFFMEQYLVKTYRKIANLVSKMHTSVVTIRMFKEEIKELARNYPEVAEMYDEKSGKLTIDRKRTGSLLYDYEIVPGSTFALDQKSQQENLAALFQMFTNPQMGPQLIQLLSNEGYEISFGEMFKKIIANSGIQDWDKIVKQRTPQENADAILGADAQRFKEAVMQASQNVNQVPMAPQDQAGMMGQEVAMMPQEQMGMM